MTKHSMFAATIAALAVAAFVSPASALTCRNGTQNVGGSWLATPYCQDLLLAEVGRERGFHASVEKIRRDPEYKKELCRGVFTDIRVTDTCLNAGIPELRR